MGVLELFVSRGTRRIKFQALAATEWNLISRTPISIANAIAAVVKPIPIASLKKAMDKAMKAYKALGATDVAAKSPEMTKAVLDGW